MCSSFSGQSYFSVFMVDTGSNSKNEFYIEGLWLGKLSNHQVGPNVNIDKFCNPSASQYLSWCQWFSIPNLKLLDLPYLLPLPLFGN
jgi:hypothetical protein